MSVTKAEALATIADALGNPTSGSVAEALAVIADDQPEVGERGAEAFTPKKEARIIKAAETR